MVKRYEILTAGVLSEGALDNIKADLYALFKVNKGDEKIEFFIYDDSGVRDCGTIRDVDVEIMLFDLRKSFSMWSDDWFNGIKYIEEVIFN
jgi:hypothetical protein